MTAIALEARAAVGELATEGVAQAVIPESEQQAGLAGYLGGDSIEIARTRAVTAAACPRADAQRTDVTAMDAEKTFHGPGSWEAAAQRAPGRTDSSMAEMCPFGRN